MIRLIDVTKYYVTNFGRHYVFRNVNLELPLDRNVGIIGPNGAGKSTFLRLLSGADQPSSGTIIKSGRISPPMGLTPGLQGSLSALENVRFAGRIYGMQRHEIDEMVVFVRELAQIGKYFDMPIETYSAGMRQRIAFGINMSMRFDYYLFDEISAGGDRDFRRAAKAMVAERLKTARFVMTSHDIDELLELCHAGIVISNGELTYFDDIRDAASFYGEAPGGGKAQKARRRRATMGGEQTPEVDAVVEPLARPKRASRHRRADGSKMHSSESRRRRRRKYVASEATSRNIESVVPPADWNVNRRQLLELGSQQQNDVGKITRNAEPVGPAVTLPESRVTPELGGEEKRVRSRNNRNGKSMRARSFRRQKAQLQGGSGLELTQSLPSRRRRKRVQASVRPLRSQDRIMEAAVTRRALEESGEGQAQNHVKGTETPVMGIVGPNEEVAAASAQRSYITEDSDRPSAELTEPRRRRGQGESGGSLSGAENEGISMVEPQGASPRGRNSGTSESQRRKAHGDERPLTSRRKVKALRVEAEPGDKLLQPECSRTPSVAHKPRGT